MEEVQKCCKTGREDVSQGRVAIFGSLGCKTASVWAAKNVPQLPNFKIWQLAV
jgi:hypothetical protein